MRVSRNGDHSRSLRWGKLQQHNGSGGGVSLRVIVDYDPCAINRVWSHNGTCVSSRHVSDLVRTEQVADSS